MKMKSVKMKRERFLQKYVFLENYSINNCFNNFIVGYFHLLLFIIVNKYYVLSYFRTIMF